MDIFSIAGKTFTSRLIIGTGKYPSHPVMVKAHEASGADMVTVAVRRVNISLPQGGGGPRGSKEESLLDYIDTSKYFILPNTAGCYTADEAVRTARLAREIGGWDWVKLEVIGDPKTLFPDNGELLVATRTLVAEGFVVLAYTNDDPVVCRRLADAGAAAVMPLGAPIGSGMGIRNPANLRIILEQASVPIIVDAGVGTASDAAIAMELGAAGVLMNEPHGYQATYLGSPGGRSSRHVQSRGLLSSRQRSHLVPCRKRLPCTLSYRTSTTSSGRTGASSSPPEPQRFGSEKRCSGAASSSGSTRAATSARREAATAHEPT